MTNIVYFQSEEGFYHEVLEEAPSRNAEGMKALKEQKEYEDIEVFLDNAWIPGRRVPAPSEHKVTFSVISFDDGRDVRNLLWRILQDAREDRDMLRKLPWIRMEKE